MIESEQIEPGVWRHRCQGCGRVVTTSRPRLAHVCQGRAGRVCQELGQPKRTMRVRMRCATIEKTVCECGIHGECLPAGAGCGPVRGCRNCPDWRPEVETAGRIG